MMSQPLCSYPTVIGGRRHDMGRNYAGAGHLR